MKADLKGEAESCPSQSWESPRQNGCRLVLYNKGKSIDQFATQAR